MLTGINLWTIIIIYFFYNEGFSSPLDQNSPYGPQGSRVYSMWPQCGSAVSNLQPTNANRGARPTELPLKLLAMLKGWQLVRSIIWPSVIIQ